MPTVTLIRIDADEAKRSITLKKSRSVIGRQTDCEIRVPVGEVSRQHCEIVIEDGGVRISDLGSSNGTEVNGRQIRSHELSPGDVIAVGPLVLVTRIDGEPSEFDVHEKFLIAKPVRAPVARGEDHPGASRTGGLLAAEGLSGDPDDSSVADFDFDFDDDEDEEQPPL
ncbi:MAG: FHA domain-containing protein [Planctomycetota bacterium]